MFKRFQDRRDAGEQLGEKLATLKLHDPIVLGIPRGGVATAAAIAERIHGDLDVVLAHKLRSPRNPEYAIGAIGEEGEVFLSRPVEDLFGVNEQFLQQEQALQMDRMESRRQLYRSICPAKPLEGRSVIITDDGIATGSTMLAAIQVTRRRDPKEVIVAVPVAPAHSQARFGRFCDQFLCLHSPADFLAVGEYYQRFAPVSDEQVLGLLRQFRNQKNRPEARQAN